MTDNQNKQEMSEDELPSFIPSENPAKVEVTPAATVEVTEEKVEEVKQTKPVEKEVNSGEAEFTLGNYKNLRRAVAFNIEGIERPLFGRGIFDFNPYKARNPIDEARIPLSVPTTGLAGIASSVEALNSLDFRKDAASRQWAGLMDEANALNTVEDAFFRAMNREGSNWEQIPRFGDRPLVGALAKQPAAENKELEGSQALLYALSALNLGAPFQAPMWHSGFWVSFRPASEDAWVNFNERLTADKIRIGRNASGLAFSNVNAIFTERALEFALEHLLDHNIRMEAGTSRRDIFKKLKAPDIPIFLWGFLVANYPSGYPINRACSAAIGSCTNIISDTINLRILQVTDTNTLDERQKAHMSKNYPNGVTEKEVEEYQSSLLCLQEREMSVIEEEKLTVKLTVKVPSAEEYILSGRRWFDGIVDMVNSILSKDVTDRRREEVYQSYAKASNLREYSHWIKEIHLNTNVVKDLISLENLLAELTPHGTIRENYYKRIEDYRENVTMSVIAIPNYKCPSCHGIQHEEKDNTRFVDCIPLDVTQAFFNLALLRILEINNR